MKPKKIKYLNDHWIFVRPESIQYDTKIPEESELMTLEEFYDSKFCADDGFGYWAKNGYYNSNLNVFSSPVCDATHVLWFNR
jgi:hypothetical protein